MMAAALRVGFVPLLDMAPLVVAEAMGFAAAEGLALELRAAPSWSSLRDMLLWGQVDAAHMLAPLPIAMALGLGAPAGRLDVLQVLNVNGNTVVVSQSVADRLRNSGFCFDFTDAMAARTSLAQLTHQPLRIGVPFPFSAHASVVDYWLRGAGVVYELTTVPPPRMADALAAGEIDAFCVGEPWGSVAVERGAGTMLLPGTAIWAHAPEKVLAARHEWVEANPEATGRLMRAVWKASRWLADRGNRMAVSELLARPEYVNAPADLLDRALRGQMVISPRGEERHVPGMIRFFDGVAPFPWRSQAAWFAMQLASAHGLDVRSAIAAGRSVFRTDLYRRNLRAVGADLPGASDKLEGALAHATAVASERGTVILPRDAFFDRRIFDPDNPEC
jgi:ABC-type nitrate/sulfonate/bicarbonate transport system substrate-binding protein